MNWVDCIIDAPADLEPSMSGFWSSALGWPLGKRWPGHPEFASFEPPAGAAYVHRQVIDGPPRVHIDLGVVDIEAETRRLCALGATAGERTDDWQVMASPGGLPFCLVLESPAKVPPSAVRWGDGHASRLAQICIDAPDSVFDAEVEFWPRATGWPLHPSRSLEFAGKCYPPDNGPLHLLLQRLGSDDGATRTRAHIDLASDEVLAEVDRLLDIGATLIGPGDGWVALRDPDGTPFCVTAQSPH
jgi:Glyoxalase-like domain